MIKVLQFLQNPCQLTFNISPELKPKDVLYLGKIDDAHVPQYHQISEQLVVLQGEFIWHCKQKLMLWGDVWLSNKEELISQFNLTLKQQITDSDLILQLWEKWGIQSLNTLQGMFAFAIWNQEKEKLYLVRDTVGSRTLYYTKKNNNYYISHRLKHLAPYHSQEIDLLALKDYLCCAFVPGERTLWNGVQELRPGTILTLPDGKIQSYWQPQEAIKNSNQSLVWHGQKLRDLLEAIMLEYLPQNQPIGIYLSGGLDSSCITALAKKFHSHPIHTYSIHFGEDCPHELEFSSLVAHHCQTKHHILEITPQKMWENLPITMSHLDDPIGDPLTVPNYLLAQLAQENSQVIFNGEGGDPCFGGPKNQPMLLSQLYNHQTNLLAQYLTSFKKCFPDLSKLLKPNINSEIKPETSPFFENLTSETQFLNRLMLINIKFKGADHILTKVSNLTRSANLQGVSPLFDQRIVQLAMATPPQYKLRGTEEKAVLKQAVADLLPEAIIKRPKSGMRVPVQYFFRQYWKRQAKSLLLSRKAKIRPYLNQEIIKNWLNYEGDLWGRYGTKLWLLVSLEVWLQVNKN